MCRTRRHVPRQPAAALLGLLLSLLALTTARAAGDGIQADVVVYGATPGGIAAAVAAAGQGAAVILIEPSGHVGGLSTSGLNTAEIEHMLPWTIGGLAREWLLRMGRHDAKAARPEAGARVERPAYEFESGVAHQAFMAMLTEAGVVLRTGVALDSVVRQGTRIVELKLSDGSRQAGKVFVDATYEGDLMAGAGVAWALGRESREAYGEEAAGIRFDRQTRKARTVDEQGRLLPGISGWRRDFVEGQAHPAVMNFNFRLIVTRDPARRVPFPEPAGDDAGRYRLLAEWLRSADAGEQARVGRMIDLYPRRNGKLEMNNMQSSIISLGYLGGQFGWAEADAVKRAAIFEDHRQYTLGLLHFLTHDPLVPAAVRADMASLGLAADEFVDNGHWPYQLYVREGRRMRGAFVVRQQDVQEERRKDDSIGMGSHFIDCHHVQRLAVSAEEFINEGRIWRKGRAYQIPYRALTPKAGECGNLLVPVAASFTHVAYCTLRVEATWMVTGQAAGVAAAMAASQRQAVQDVPVGRLQEILRAQGQVIDFMPGKPEVCESLNGPPEF